MNLLKNTFLLFLSIGLFPFWSSGQSNLPQDFGATLERMELLLAIPVERAYKNKRVRRNDFFEYDYAIRSRKHKVEIRYALLPQEKALQIIPSVHSTATVTSLASNEERYSAIAVHSISDQELLDDFNADWGSVTYFQPKRSFSKFRYGKLLSLYKAERGMAYVLFLFNKGEEEEVERQFYALRFGEE